LRTAELEREHLRNASACSLINAVSSANGRNFPGTVFASSASWKKPECGHLLFLLAPHDGNRSSLFAGAIPDFPASSQVSQAVVAATASDRRAIRSLPRYHQTAQAPSQQKDVPPGLVSNHFTTT
jgi:hypothetical protein